MPSNIAVLLPVRMETRFYPPDAALNQWRLRVLIVPDEPWLNRHNPAPTEQELDALAVFYNSAPAGVNSPEGPLAWEVLASHISSPARAEWLIRTFPAGSPPPAASMPLVYNQIFGFPKKLELWMARGGQPAQLMSTWAVDLARLDVSLPDPRTQQERWYTAWKEAVGIGLGVEIPLGAQAPNDIDVLYVTGLSGANAEDLFVNHRQAGALGVVEPGTPTNTVAGQPAADLGRSPATWFDIAVNGNPAGPGSAQLSHAVAGHPSALGSLVGDGFDHAAAGRALVSSLWSVLWGRTLKDIWGLGDDVQVAGQWASAFVQPEGPVAPVRVMSQPYGVLPVTSLAQWTKDPADPQPSFAGIEAGIAPYLANARHAFASIAAARGNASGANTELLLEAIGAVPGSDQYLYRTFLSKEVLEYFYGQFPTGTGDKREQDFDRWWNERAAPASPWMPAPVRQYVAAGNPQNLKLALVAPDDIARDTKFGDYCPVDTKPLPSVAFNDYKLMAQAPSLLVRMLAQALLTTAAEVHRAAQGMQGPSLEPPVSSASFTQIVQWALALTDADLAAAAQHPSRALYDSTRKGIELLKSRPVGELDRALRAALDSACYRIDPWINAIAWRRFSQAAAGPRPLGAYGWVDAPKPGKPGPTPGGLLHAPSERQAIVSAILRDKFVNDPQPSRWDMNLTSKSVRAAERIADEVRAGAPVQEVLGREIERIAGKKATVDSLRAAFPIHQAHAGRRVCDGQAVLKANPASLGFTATQLSALADLAAAVDAYADLLVAQAVDDVVSGRGAVAAAAMDAAAGLGMPPNLDVIRTPRTGRSLNTNVAVLLPYADKPPVDPATSPVEMAEPAAASFLKGILGDASQDDWSWDLLLANGSTGVRYLSEIGWSPSDAAAVTEEALARLIAGGAVIDNSFLARDAQGAVQTVKLSSLGLTPEALAALSEEEIRQRIAAQAGPGNTVIGEAPQKGSASQAKAKRIWQVLGERPAVPEQLADEPSSEDAPRTELVKRFDALRQLASLAIASSAGLAAQAALERLARWGIAPIATEGDTPDQLKAKAIAALTERLQAAPQLAEAQSMDTVSIARAIAELASSDAKIPVLAPIDLDSYPIKLSSEDLDRDWLPVNASVRPALARLEVFQLEGEMSRTWSPLAAHTNRPGDPWQLKTDTVGGSAQSTRLVAAYAAGPVGGKIAAGLLDSWGEVAPDTEQATAAAFGFNAPAARAPQAILLAVSPDVSKPLDGAGLIGILAETRELALARAMTPSGAAPYNAAVPMTMLPLLLN